MWLAAQTQWRASFGGLIGLDYPAVFQLAELYGIEMTPGMMSKVQALERATLKRANKVPDK